MEDTLPSVDVAPLTSKPRRFVFVLLPNFTLLSFASALDSLRLANQMAGKELYSWTLIGEGGQTMRCSSGVEMNLDDDLCELSRDDTVLICGGLNIQDAVTRKLLSWMRREARRGLMMGGLCTATYALARAGLISEKRATIHWENQDSFAEEFHDVHLTKRVFVIDGNRFSTAGGTSSIDLMLHFIAADYGQELANGVADQLGA